MNTRHPLDQHRGLALAVIAARGLSIFRADVATQPLRIFGYGSLERMTVSADGKLLFLQLTLTRNPSAGSV